MPTGASVIWSDGGQAQPIGLPGGQTLTWSTLQLSDYDLTMYGGPGVVDIEGNSSLTDNSNFTTTASPLQNDGTMTLNDSSLNIYYLTGTGTIDATNGSTITLDVDTVPSTETINLDSTSHLILLDPSDPPPGAPTPDVASVTAQSLGIAVSNPDIGEAYRLYQAGLDRVPDQSGLTFWTSNLLDGVQPITLAGDFAGSAEFLQDYGNLAPTDFVNTMYQNVLGRAPDAAGGAFWTGCLNAGESKAAVLLSFSDCAENRINTNIFTHETTV